MDNIKHLLVKHDSRKVGTLALYQDKSVAFEYDKQWLVDGFSISPFSLPLERKVFIPDSTAIGGLYGVFSDSLPGIWGRLIVDRTLLQQQVNLQNVTSLQRLALVADGGMGALEYESNDSVTTPQVSIDLDELALASMDLLEKKPSDKLADFFALSRTSGGAGAKIFVNLNDEDWIVKFPHSYDPANSGQREYDYAICAKKCGIIMSEVRLFASALCDGYFITKRFDRENGVKKHVISANALLEVPGNKTVLDYDTLMKLTFKLTKDYSEIEKLYRLMCFNVFSKNRDDHSRNFSFIYNEQDVKWELSPAYDLTYSYATTGERATALLGNRQNPGEKELLEIAKRIGFNSKKAKIIADDIKDCVHEMLVNYIEN